MKSVFSTPHAVYDIHTSYFKVSNPSVFQNRKKAYFLLRKRAKTGSMFHSESENEEIMVSCAAFLSKIPEGK